jgi:Ca2+-binding RTX toxin-like protein
MTKWRSAVVLSLVAALASAGLAATVATPAQARIDSTCPSTDGEFIEADDDGGVTFGTPGDDHILGGDGNDIIYGLGGNDFIYGGEGVDLIHGGACDDIIIGGPRNDGLWGGEGDDKLVGEEGNDAGFGGSGTNYCDVEHAGSQATEDEVEFHVYQHLTYEGPRCGDDVSGDGEL